MKFTSEDLLKAMGLKVGDRIKFDNKEYVLCKNDYQDYHSYVIRETKPFGDVIKLMNLLDWNYEIIQPKPTLTEDEKNFAQLAFNQGYRYLSKNKREKVASITKGNPIRCSDDTWFVESEFYFYLNMFPNLFQFIKWEDEPYSIEELLKEN